MAPSCELHRDRSGDSGVGTASGHTDSWVGRDCAVDHDPWRRNPRLLGGIFGISLLILAGATLLISGFVVRLVPTDALELRAAEFAPSGLGDQLVGQTADGLRGAGAGNGPILAIIGVALLTVGAAFPSLRRNRAQQQPAHAGEQASAPPPPPPSPPPPQPPSPPLAGTPPPPPATWWETSEGLDR